MTFVHDVRKIWVHFVVCSGDNILLVEEDVCVCVCVCTYVERGKERERDTETGGNGYIHCNPFRTAILASDSFWN